MSLPRRDGKTGERGQASVELIIVLPVLLLVTAAVCQVALGLNCYLVVISASREGARKGAETNDMDAAREAARKASSGLPGDRPTVEVDFPEGRARGRPIRVTVIYRMPLLIPVVGRLVPRSTFSRSTSMALERGE